MAKLGSNPSDSETHNTSFLSRLVLNTLPKQDALYVNALTFVTVALAVAALFCVLSLFFPHVFNGTPTHFVSSSLIALCALITLGGLVGLRSQAVHLRRTPQISHSERVHHKLQDLNLTALEMSIANDILQQKGYREIAKRNEVSERTIQSHASIIFKKASVTNRRDFERTMASSSYETLCTTPCNSHKETSRNTPCTPLESAE